ncbi:thermonuclease family protein [Chryseolinea lacunae]|uniref:Thermonuclease family protein n=1 Tax=Chryseolinea lacunae TaxID=2801331 RepID=A0ABS1KSY4_9BACT|nr:thermonuclease family protein [Chryseolinea lacunae]MBL0742303.1 thermonuclease family protein [Chryseolinea lacunae]
MRTTIGSFMIAFLFGSAALAGDEVKGKVIAVIDGNTLSIAGDDNQTHQVMLAGIDSPELEQEFGEKAKSFLEKIVLKKEVTVKFTGKDRWGNYLAEVLVNGKEDPRIELLKQGYAWTAEKNPVPDLESYRTSAQQKGKGLWKQENPTPPWTFRRQQTMLQAKSS